MTWRIGQPKRGTRFPLKLWPICWIKCQRITTWCVVQNISVVNRRQSANGDCRRT
jgi:hypothetical protein